MLVYPYVTTPSYVEKFVKTDIFQGQGKCRIYFWLGIAKNFTECQQKVRELCSMLWFYVDNVELTKAKWLMMVTGSVERTSL